MRDHLLGAHDVPYSRLWAIARARSVVPASVVPIGIGFWIIVHEGQIFSTPMWQDMRWLLEGYLWVLSWLIMIGGFLGILGLVARMRSLSVASCAVCLFWFAWIDTFLWYANFTNAPNLFAWGCLYPLFEYAYRLVLLARPPRPGEAYGHGW